MTVAPPPPSLPAELWEWHILPRGGPLHLSRDVGACVKHVSAMRVQRCWRARVPWVLWARENDEVSVCTSSSAGWRPGCVSYLRSQSFGMVHVYDEAVPNGGYHLLIQASGSPAWVVRRRSSPTTKCDRTNQCICTI